MTQADRVELALEQSLCFACANYRDPFSTFSGICRNGGLSPERANAPDASWDTRLAWLTVRWDNKCARFALAMQVAA